MTVKSLTRLFQIKALPDTPVEKVWILLSRRDISLVPVVSSDNTLLGVIGEDDLLYRLVPDYLYQFSDFFQDTFELKDIEEKFAREIQLTASDVMTRDVVAARDNQTIFKALAKMMANHIRWLPVINENRKYLGMIGEDDIMQFLFKKHRNTIKSVSRRRTKPAKRK